MMGTATLEVSGPDSARQAAELHATLTAGAHPGDTVSPVEVQRSAEIVIAIIGLVFTGIDTAKTIWDWWHSRHPEGTTVKILLSDGTQLDLSNISRDQLEISFQQATSQH
jgi:pantothenate kinase